VIVGACGPARPERSGDPALDADVRVSPTPAVLRGSRVTVAARDDRGPLVGATVRVRVVRRDVAAAPNEATWREALPVGAAAGTYGPVEFDFPAPGDWWVVVELRSLDRRVATLRHPLSVVGAASSEVGR
jgi:hypothetical protein